MKDIFFQAFNLDVFYKYNISIGTTYLRKKRKMIVKKNKRAYFGHTNFVLKVIDMTMITFISCVLHAHNLA